MTDLPAVDGYRPDAEMRKKLGDFLEAFAESGNVVEAAEKAKLNRTNLYRVREKYKPLDDAWTKIEFERRAIVGDEVRQALIEKALVDRNTHAIIHADKIYNKHDYQQPKQEKDVVQSNGLTINIVVPPPPRPDEIPEGDPSRIIEILPPAAELEQAYDDEDDDSLWDLEDEE